MPKGVVRDIGGYLVALKWSMSAIYDVKPGDTYWAASDIGWVVGHSYIVYAPLHARLRQRALRGQADRHARRRRFLAGDRGLQGRRLLHRADRLPRGAQGGPGGDAAQELRHRLAAHAVPRRRARRSRTPSPGRETILGVPVVDHWWQTETGWAIAANPVGLGILPIKLGSPTVPMPGYDVDVVDEACHPVADGRDGLDRHQAAAAARLPADPLPAGRAHARELPQGVPRLLQDLRRRLHRRGRLPLPSSAAPTTSSMSPATASRPAAWRR